VSEKLRFNSKIPQEQLFAELSREFARMGWEPRVQGDVFVAEDGKSVDAVAAGALVVLGFVIQAFSLLPVLFTPWLPWPPLLLAFSFGLLLWMFAAAYVAGADRRKVMVVRSEDPLYEVVYSDWEARGAFLNVLRKLAEAQKAEPFEEPSKPAEPTPEQVYEKMLSAYAKLYGTSAAAFLERELEKLEKQGLSREEAIKALGRKLGFAV